MPPRLNVFRSSVGTKVVIALTGLALVGFLVGHLAGNLLVLVGPGPFNAYSEALIRNPLLVPAELGLVAIFLLHIYKTVRMYAENRRARPIGYQEKKWTGHTSRKSVGSTTMIYTGLVTLGFVILHVRTFKYGPYYLVEGTEARDLYRLVIEVFSSPLYVAFYVVCMALVGFHLRHGVSSAFQSLGLEHPRLSQRLVVAGKILAVVIGAGFALIPLWVFFLGSRS